MIAITYFGHSAFKIRGRKASLVTDPYGKEVFGRLMPKLAADIVTISHFHDDHNALERVSGEPFIVKEPGEYEIKGVFILGIPSFHDNVLGAKRGKNTIYSIEIEGVKICHLGDLGHRLSEKEQEEINGVSVLMIPVGGVYTIDAKKAVEIINQVEPKIVMPMHYRLPDSKIELGSLDKFLSEMGERTTRKLEVLKISKDKIPEEGKIVVLNAHS